MIAPLLLATALAAQPAAAAAVPPAPDPQPALEALGLPLILSLVERPRAYFVLVSGDGGWSSLDKTMASHLGGEAIATVGLNSFKYFWKERTPEGAAVDLKRILEVVGRAGVPVFLAGYSFGAEVVPVLLDRPEFKGSGISGVVLIAPGPYASFEVHMTDWLRSKEKPTPHLVLDHLRRLDSLPILCLVPEKDEESVCPPLSGRKGFEMVRLPGAHHFDGDYLGLAKEVSRFIDGIVPPAAERAP